MTELSTLVGNSGGSLPLEHNGVTYHLHKMTDEARARFENWMKQQAFKGAREQRKFLSPAEANALVAGICEDISLGLYAYGGEKYLKWASTSEGNICLLSLMLRVDDPEVVRELWSEHEEEINTILSTLYAEPDPKA